MQYIWLLWNSILDHQLAYLMGDILFGIVWLTLFILRKDLRREMWVMSAIGAILSPLALVYLPDYWYPEHITGPFMLGIEDFLFAFFIAGIGAVLYEVVTNRVHTLCECRRVPKKRIIGIIIMSVLVLLASLYGFKLNSIYANYLAFGFLFAYIIYFRRDLLWQSLVSGFMVALLMFIFYQVWITIYPGIIEHWWKLSNISGVLIFGVPFEEIIWGASWGMAGGSIYEYVRGIGTYSMSSKRLKN